MSELLQQAEPLVEGMRNKILQELGERVEPLADRSWGELAPEIETLTGSIEQADAWRAADVQGAVFLKLSAALLAIYRTLQPVFADNQKLLDLLQEVTLSAFYADGMEAFLLKRFGVTSEAPDKAWDQVCKNFIQRGREQFGQSWVYEQGVKDHRRCFVNIRKCGFADFFLAHGASEVLYLLCGGDFLWADALEEYGIRFERPTILAEGNEACRFQFFKAIA